MGSPLEGPNPLRPYYVPPSIGLPQGKPETLAKSPPSAPPGNVTALGSSARDMISDFDYSDYLGDSSPSVVDSVRQLLEQALWRYSRTLTSQPFEVAKTILQVYVAEDDDEKSQTIHASRRQGEGFRDDHSDEDASPDSDDESNYFASASQLPRSPSTPQHHRPPRRVTDRSGYIPQTSRPKYMLKIKDPTALFDVLSQLWTTSGPASIWKASTSTFIYSLLLPTLNTFIRSLLSAVLGFPEDPLSAVPDFDILTSSSPATMLLISGISSALSSIILSPIDTARTYLILTPQTQGSRSLLRAVRQLPSPNYLIPPHLLPITVLTSTLPNLLAQSTPLFLKSYLSLDPLLNPSSWSLFTFMSSGLEIGLRVPLETVLRRAQIATFTSPILRQQNALIRTPGSSGKSPISPTSEGSADAVKTIVNTPQTYRGIIGTMWGIIHEEGTMPPLPETQTVEQILHFSSTSEKNATHKRTNRSRKGQGVQGLYRSWRMEMWGIVGIWGSGILGALLGAGDEEMSSSSTDTMGVGGAGIRF